MLPAKASRATTASDGDGPRRTEQLGRRLNSLANKKPSDPQTDNRSQPIRAMLNGSDKCSAAGLTGRSTTPVLALCRELLAAGVDPDRAMDVYRGATLALRVRSICEAARLTVRSAGNGAPIFALDRAHGGAVAPPVRKSCHLLPQQRPRGSERGRAP
jgi:hypothetical protein